MITGMPQFVRVMTCPPQIQADGRGPPGNKPGPFLLPGVSPFCLRLSCILDPLCTIPRCRFPSPDPSLSDPKQAVMQNLIWPSRLYLVLFECQCSFPISCLRICVYAAEAEKQLDVQFLLPVLECTRTRPAGSSPNDSTFISMRPLLFRDISFLCR